MAGYVDNLDVSTPPVQKVTQLRKIQDAWARLALTKTSSYSLTNVNAGHFQLSGGVLIRTDLDRKLGDVTHFSSMHDHHSERKWSIKEATPERGIRDFSMDASNDLLVLLEDWDLAEYVCSHFVDKAHSDRFLPLQA